MDDEINEVSEEKSELMQLLVKNTRQGLTGEEYRMARQLIANPVYTNKKCGFCKEPIPENMAIYDTGMCQGHAYYALVRRK